MYSLLGWFWSLPFPLLQESPGFLTSRAFPSPLSFRTFCLLSVHNAYSAAPLQCLVPPIVRPPSSVRRRATNPLAPADQCSLLDSRPIVLYAGLHPLPTYTAGGTWLGCGCVWRGERRRRPPRWSWVRRLAGRHHRTSACPRLTFDFPLDSCGLQYPWVPRRRYLGT